MHLDARAVSKAAASDDERSDDGSDGGNLTLPCAVGFTL